jgi:hypothetical protein
MHDRIADLLERALEVDIVKERAIVIVSISAIRELLELATGDT